MEKFTNEFFSDLLSNATNITEAIQIMRNVQAEMEKSDGRKKAEEFGEKFNSFILKNWSIIEETRQGNLEKTPKKYQNFDYNSTFDDNEISGNDHIFNNYPNGSKNLDEISENSEDLDKDFRQSRDLNRNSRNGKILNGNLGESGSLDGDSKNSKNSDGNFKNVKDLNKSSKDGENLDISLKNYSKLLYHPYGEMDVAELFGILYKDKMHFVSEKKMYYIFNGKKWVPDLEHIQVKTYVKEFVKLVLGYLLENEKDNAEEVFFYNSYLGWKKRANLIEDSKTIYPLSVRDFDVSMDLFNCQNGTLRLDTNEFYEHRATDLLSQVSNVEYKKEASCKRWEEFISEIMDGDLACIEFLQMICGLFLTSYTDEECFFLFYGIGGRNGKSTLCDTLLYLMGDYAKETIPSTITRGSNNCLTRPNEEIAKLRGCRLLSITGEDRELQLDTRLMKNLIKQDRVTARFPYQESFDYSPQFKIVISTNYLPRVNDSRIFASNQLILLPFPVHFQLGEEEIGLKEFFCQPENLSGIFNWCLEGLEKYMTLRSTSRQGLKFYLPKKIKERIEECKQEQDFSSVATFIQENLLKNEDKSISAKELFQAYSKWCKQKDYSKCNYRSFVREIRKQKKLTRRRKGFVILGHTLKEESLEEE